MTTYELGKNKKPLRCSLERFCELIASENRVTKLTRLDSVDVSTVFLGINHRFVGVGKPILWETMVFSDSNKFNGYMIRATSHKQALKNHYLVVAAFRNNHLKTLLNWS